MSKNKDSFDEMLPEEDEDAAFLLPDFKTHFRKGPTRNAMGEYIPPPGGKPLTSLADDYTPAPSDYSPKIDMTKEAAPHFSITGPYKVSKTGVYEASAMDYNTSLDMIWKQKYAKIKGKGKMRPYDMRDDAHINDSIGPARYKIDHEVFGTTGPKHSMSRREGIKVHAGPPNKLVAPVDTHGIANPGPDYRPNSSYWGRGPKKSFGNSRKVRPLEGPGPAEYTVVDSQTGASYSLARRLPSPLQWRLAVNRENPAPCEYELGTTVGKAMSKTISGRPEIIERESGPAPNMYTLPDSMEDSFTAPMTYRRFEPAEKPHPGPTTYSLTDRNLKKQPVYTVRRKTRPCFPDILHYPLVAQNSTKNPGPGNYEHKTDFSANEGPKYSMAKRAKPRRSSVPGPNHYELTLRHRPDAKKAPSFTMAKRFDGPARMAVPGPADYFPALKVVENNGPSFSMTNRPRDNKKKDVPGPNAYILREGQTVRGAKGGNAPTFKSRASPFVYSGFQTARISDG